MANDKDFIVKNAVEVGGPTNVTLGSITGNAINLSTGNYFADTLAANTTYTISNAGDVQAFELEVTGASVGFDIASATFGGASATISQAATNPSGFFISPDGVYVYPVNMSNARVYRYKMTTPWDITTTFFDSMSFGLSTQESAPTGVFFKPDGTIMYMIGDAQNQIFQYTLTTPWDINAGISYANKTITLGQTQPYGLFFKPDGTKMYTTQYNDSIKEWSLSTAWDITTATSTGTSGFIAGTALGMKSLSITSDGKNVFVIGIDQDRIYNFELTTAWDITTISYVSNISVELTDNQLRSCFLKTDDNSKIYTFGNQADKMNQFSLPSVSATITWPTSIEFAGGVAPAAPATGETDVFTFSTDDGGTSYIGTKTADNLS
jgi:hypothetical protein